MTYSYFDRDLSWLSFNERILMEAARAEVPVLERLNFLAIFSSNLDEFYRVRMPAIFALGNHVGPSTQDGRIGADKDSPIPEQQIGKPLLAEITDCIDRLQEAYGQVLTRELMPLMARGQVFFLYNKKIPDFLTAQAASYFYERIAAFINPLWMDLPCLPEVTGQISQDLPLAVQGRIISAPGKKGAEPQKRLFFPENDQIYLAVFIRNNQERRLGILNIPTEMLPRFYSMQHGEDTFVTTLDDILRMQLPAFLEDPSKSTFLEGSYSFKMTRDAAVDYRDDYGQDLADFIEGQIEQRAFGLATRLLYDAAMSKEHLAVLVQVLACEAAILVKGGTYHNLKDLAKFPAHRPGWRYETWPAISYDFSRGDGLEENEQVGGKACIFDQIAQRDRLISPPYHRYTAVLRFFNEAAIHPEVAEIAVTLYRIAGDSQIAHALISAAKNGKKVTVFVELKARFDEANNVKWAKKMKAAGVRIIYSIWALKVHAKVALVKRRRGKRMDYYGIFATGNFNENTAAFYADYILMTARKEMLAELETLLLFLEKRASPENYSFYQPKRLLVAGFNLLEMMLGQIENCIQAARKGQPAAIILKLNNLEEKTLINKLYEASGAGVKIELIIRSICRLIPGKAAMSENIRVRRLVDRYLEHSRVYIFKASDQESVFLGSADWMNRNIYRRIEVCFPILDPVIVQEIKTMMDLQLADNIQAVELDGDLKNRSLRPENAALPGHRAQWETWQYLSQAN